MDGCNFLQNNRSASGGDLKLKPRRNKNGVVNYGRNLRFEAQKSKLGDFPLLFLRIRQPDPKFISCIGSDCRQFRQSGLSRSNRHFDPLRRESEQIVH